MNTTTSLQIVSTLLPDAHLVVELLEAALPALSSSQVLVRVEAAPINPSDLLILFGRAPLDKAQFGAERITATVPPEIFRALAARVGVPMIAGNEGAGTVVGTGESAEARALLGKRVACIAGGGMYAQYCVVEAGQCMVLPEPISAEQGASSFVNPMTALGFVETARRGQHAALIHTAAASNLGRMLVRICQQDRIPLVNVVRSQAQVRLLRDLGAQHVIDSSRDSFEADLAAALQATRATLLFDPIGGGTLVDRILMTMERVASQGGPYNRYGSPTPKQAYIYGSLDLSPTILTRHYGLNWSVGGWLLTTLLQSLAPEQVAKLRQRVLEQLTTTFASHYRGRLSLSEALSREHVLAYDAKQTGAKYLIVPSQPAR